MRVYQKKSLEKIWSQVPVNYYQRGVRKNYFQKFWHQKKLKILKKMIPQKPKSILDLGCASGFLTNELKISYPNSKIVGVDIYKNAIKYAEKRYKNIEFICADAHKLPFALDRFDVILLSDVLDHVVNPKKVLLEAKRCLKKDGRLLLELDSGSQIYKVVWFLWTNYGPGKVWRKAHITSFSNKKLESLISSVGFKIDKKKYFNFRFAVAYRLRIT